MHHPEMVRNFFSGCVGTLWIPGRKAKNFDAFLTLSCRRCCYYYVFCFLVKGDTSLPRTNSKTKMFDIVGFQRANSSDISNSSEHDGRNRKKDIMGKLKSNEEEDDECDTSDTITSDDESFRQDIPEAADVLLGSRNGHFRFHPSAAGIQTRDPTANKGSREYHQQVIQLAESYATIKRKYRETAHELVMNSVQMQGGRFLERDGNGFWRVVPKTMVWRKITQEFKKTCRDLGMNEQKIDFEEAVQMAELEDQQVITIASSAVSAPTPSDTDAKLSSSTSGTDHPNTISHYCLVLNGYDNDHDGALKFAKGLGLNSSLVSLEINLSSLDSHQSNIDALATLATLAGGIRTCQGLEQVKLRYENTPFDSIFMVLVGILDNHSIESLNLDDNDIDAAGMTTLCKLILGSQSSQLKRLSLQNNAFGDDGAAALEQVITSTETLRYLCLRNNMLSENGIAILKKAIMNKKDYMFEITGLKLAKAKCDESQEFVQPPPRKKQDRQHANMIISNPRPPPVPPSDAGDSGELKILPMMPCGTIDTTNDQAMETESRNSDDDGQNSSSNSGSDEGQKSSLSGYAASSGSDDGRNEDNSGEDISGGTSSSHREMNGSSASSDDGRSGNSSGSEEN